MPHLQCQDFPISCYGLSSKNDFVRCCCLKTTKRRQKLTLALSSFTIIITLIMRHICNHFFPLSLSLYLSFSIVLFSPLVYWTERPFSVIPWWFASRRIPKQWIFIVEYQMKNDLSSNCDKIKKKTKIKRECNENVDNQNLWFTHEIYGISSIGSRPFSS